MKEILKKVRKYEIEIRKYLNNSNQGDYNSIFKGSGIDFDDLRPYQYGDDHRSINWNITAKEDKIYTNTYKEDKPKLNCRLNGIRKNIRPFVLTNDFATKTKFPQIMFNVRNFDNFYSILNKHKH